MTTLDLDPNLRVPVSVSLFRKTSIAFPLTNTLVNILITIFAEENTTSSSLKVNSRIYLAFRGVV